MATTAGYDDAPVHDLSTLQRGLLILVLMLSTTIYSASVLISSALLPQLQGALSATQDEVSWVMTFNIVATAVATPAAGWLAARFGQRSTMTWCAGVFAISTFMCGASNSLEELIGWRIVQGAAGAPLIPLGQTILLDSFPRRQHGTILSIYGMGNMIGPSLGPMFAGQIAETLGWRWGFWMVVPLAVASFIGSWLVLPKDDKVQGAKLDWLGFLTLSAGIAAAQLVFSRGQRLDWFESYEIIIATLVAGLALYIFCVHSLTSERPFIQLKLLTDRNYSLGLILVMLFGMLNFATVVLLPPLLQQHAGYPDSAIGDIVGYRGLGSGIGFLLAMPMARLDPRISLGDRRLAAGLHGLLDDGLRSQRQHSDGDPRQYPARRLHRRVVGAAHRHHLLDTGAGIPRRGDVDVPPVAQLRLEPVHLDCRGRDRAHLDNELRAHDGACLRLQSCTGHAVGDGRVDGRYRPGPRQGFGRDRAPGHAYRLQECVGALRDRIARVAAAVPAGAAAKSPDGLNPESDATMHPRPQRASA